MEHKDREPEQLSVSIDMILAHIDQELTWASESTNSDGWSYQVVAATIAAIAVFVFQSFATPPDWGQVLTRFLVISYCWDTVFGLYSWIKRGPGSATTLTTATRGFSTRRLAPVRALGLFTLSRVVFLLLLTWVYGLQHLGLFLAILISAQLLLRLLVATTVVFFLLGDWYPPIEQLGKESYSTATTRAIGILEIGLAAAAAAAIALYMVPMVGNTATLPAAGLVAVVHLTHLLLSREGVAGHVEPLRSLRRELVLGLIAPSKAQARLSDILMGEPLDTVVAAFMARHRELGAEGARLLKELNRHADVLEAGTGPVTPDGLKERLALIKRVKQLYAQQQEANKETERLFVGRGWRALRLKLDARWGHAHSQFRATYAELLRQAEAMPRRTVRELQPILRSRSCESSV
jgi:hypothetical protein